MPRTRKACKTCGVYRNLEEFPVNRKSGNYMGTCDLCVTKKKEERRNTKYKLESGELQELRESQNDRCAICSREVFLCVDHDHETGAIRGLLCYKCNSGLGMFDDSITLLKRAQGYLTRAKFAQTTIDDKLKKLVPGSYNTNGARSGKPK